MLDLQTKRIEYILEWNLKNEFCQSLSAWKCTKCTSHVNGHKLYAVEYINTVCSLDYPFQFQIF